MRALILPALVLSLMACGGDAAPSVAIDVGTVCTCLAPEEWDFDRNVCDGPTYRFGCREAPQQGRLGFDVPPGCWRQVVDPATGCLKPEPTLCNESCWPGGRDGDAGPPEDARPLDGGA